MGLSGNLLKGEKFRFKKGHTTWNKGKTYKILVRWSRHFNYCSKCYTSDKTGKHRHYANGLCYSCYCRKTEKHTKDELYEMKKMRHRYDHFIRLHFEKPKRYIQKRQRGAVVNFEIKERFYKMQTCMTDVFKADNVEYFRQRLELYLIKNNLWHQKTKS